MTLNTLNPGSKGTIVYRGHAGILVSTVSSASHSVKGFRNSLKVRYKSPYIHIGIYSVLGGGGDEYKGQQNHYTSHDGVNRDWAKIARAGIDENQGAPILINQ